jgi:hypothetical protein
LPRQPEGQTSPTTRQKHLQLPFPDGAFATAFALALTQTDPRQMLETLHTLTQSIANHMGGFQIDGWSLRTPVT